MRFKQNRLRETKKQKQNARAVHLDVCEKRVTVAAVHNTVRIINTSSCTHVPKSIYYHFFVTVSRDEARI